MVFCLWDRPKPKNEKHRASYRSAENRHDGRSDRQDKPRDPVVEQEGVLGRGVGSERKAPQVRVARLSPVFCRCHDRRSLLAVSGGEHRVGSGRQWGGSEAAVSS